MSLKSIELQIAIPKTFEAGKLAEQKNQQSALNHQQAAVQTEEQVQKQRNTVMDTAQSEKTDNSRSGSGEGREGGRETDQEEQKKELYASHPYKGGFVDYTG